MSNTFGALILGFLLGICMSAIAISDDNENYENKISQLEKNNKVLNTRLIDCSN
jgi:hypothetical protein